ncbi:hypothetical protein MK858_02285 [Streptococcus infantarius]|uniref:hypothetical protein n=1 Tax=Streptococcus infantarius TaxID=102684 RepID=UPI002283E775|nr:hypothetical protein [Streptococcus infantarius]MCY7237891.1 hypothetical protein [Streptococcus infantarius]
MKLIASNQITLTNLLERAIDRTEVTFWHGLSATKHPLGVYDCGGRDHTFGNEFSVTSGKTYTVRVIAKQTKGSLKFAGGIWYTAMTSGNAWDGYAPFTLVGETSEDGLGIYERKFVVESGKTKAKIFIQIEQTAGGGYSTAWRIYDGQVFDENGQPLVTDQNNLGALTSPMAAPDGTYIWKRTITYYTDGTNNTIWEYSGIGDKGNTGADGKTPYVHWAYADDSNGTNFSLTDKNQQFQGYYSDYTEADSTDYTKYKWVDRLANVQVGGRNYIRDFGFANNPNFNNKTSSWKYERIADPTARSGYHIKATCIGAGNNGFHRYLIDLRGTEWQGRMMTYSIDIKASKSVRMRLGAEAFNKGYKAFDVTTNWQRFISTDTVNFKTFYSFPFYADTITWAVGDIIYIRDPQLEDGNVATTPIPALEDTQEQIDSKADQTLTQDQLNALAEKNNLIKAEMEAKASIDTVNQWITAYQNYVKANDADKAKSEQALKDASERILAIRYEVNNLKVVWDAIDTYMSFQNEGLVIGKKDGSAYAKFSDDRISLFSGSSEVMYISQGTLNIANGIFTKTIQIGRFRFETHPADADMLVVRFVGG